VSRTGWSGALLAAAAMLVPAAGAAQTITQRGFAEARGLFFPQEALNDPVQAVGDLLVREEVFLKPAPWIEFAGGIDARANSHDQVDASWRIDLSDRGRRRPALSVRRLSATVARGPLTVEIGKQFIRWGTTDLVTPTDRFAPRDFLTVIDNELLAVAGVRASLHLGAGALDVAWVPRFTPSRVPLYNQRWTVLPPEAAGIVVVDAGAVLPGGQQAGIRWSQAASRLEYALSFFDGYNNLPNMDARGPEVPAGRPAFPPRVDVIRVYPAIRTYGADASLPTRWLTLKTEAAYFTSPSASTDEYVLYVVQLERQSGEWAFVGGYAGEAVTAGRAVRTFAPDRGLTHAVIGSASYTIDANRGVRFETAVRENGDGAYLKAEFSQAYRDRWRLTLSGALIRGVAADFLGQYRRNSHVISALRYSF
jgi:hypothetical protein